MKLQHIKRNLKVSPCCWPPGVQNDKELTTLMEHIHNEIGRLLLFRLFACQKGVNLEATSDTAVYVCSYWRSLLRAEQRDSTLCSMQGILPSTINIRNGQARTHSNGELCVGKPRNPTQFVEKSRTLRM